MKNATPSKLTRTPISTRPVDFALAQLEVDPKEKELAARWAVCHLPLTSGAGIVLDAGTSCLAVWESLVEQICTGRLAHLLVYTNNLLVLEHWRDHVSTPQIRETKVKLFGWELDPSHMAFYGSEDARKKLLSDSLRPSIVYIGTSGIEFDAHRGILFGYHQDDAEREIKELLFKCYAKTRIILSTPSKMGQAGGQVLNLLSIPHLDAEAPIYLITTRPKPGERKKIKDQFDRAKKTFASPEIQNAIRQKGIDFHWIVVDPESGEVPKELEHLRAPSL